MSDWGLNQIIFWLFISPVKSCVGVFRICCCFSIEPERYVVFRADVDPDPQINKSSKITKKSRISLHIESRNWLKLDLLFLKKKAN